MYFICHVTSHDDLTERACVCLGGISLSYVTTVISLIS